MATFDRLLRFPISVLSYFVPKCTIFEISNFKNAVTLKTGLGVRQGHLKYHPSIERIQLPIVVSEIFNVEKCRDLEIAVRGHSRSLSVVSY